MPDIFAIGTHSLRRGGAIAAAMLVFQIAFLSGMTAGLVNLLRMVTLKILYPRVRLFLTP